MRRSGENPVSDERSLKPFGLLMGSIMLCLGLCSLSFLRRSQPLGPKRLVASPKEQAVQFAIAGPIDFNGDGVNDQRRVVAMIEDRGNEVSFIIVDTAANPNFERSTLGKEAAANGVLVLDASDFMRTAAKRVAAKRVAAKRVARSPSN